MTGFCKYPLPSEGGSVEEGRNSRHKVFPCLWNSVRERQVVPIAFSYIQYLECIASNPTSHTGILESGNQISFSWQSLKHDEIQLNRLNGFLFP